MVNEVKPKARIDSVVTTKTDNELLVYDLKTNRAVCLNSTAAAVFESCDGKNSIREIGMCLESFTGMKPPKELILLTLAELEKYELIEKFGDNGLELSRSTRRELVKRAALGTAMALPIISSLIAPSAVMAASCLTPGPIPSGDEFFSLTPNGVFCGNPTGVCSAAFCEERGTLFCRSCSAELTSCVDRATDAFCSCRCL